MNITSPTSEKDFENYFSFRWRLMRAPWNQPKGSEQDEMEDSAFHVMVCENNRIPIGTGRLHLNNADEAQIRYMAVEKFHRGRGLGTSILSELEKEAKKRGAKSIILNARESAIPFYRSAGYTILEPSHTLFGSIKHFKMTKHI
jgi:GNAT superfamily N-acetyltransferase